MTAPTGRDGRPLITTGMAAYWLEMKPASFRGWATRHGVRPVMYRPNPNGGQQLALWDVSVLGEARYGSVNPMSV